MNNRTEGVAGHNAVVVEPEVIGLHEGLEVAARLGTADHDVVLIRSRMASGDSVPLHSHGEFECVYVIDGCIDVFVLDADPRWHRVDANRSLFLEADVKHAVRNSGERSVDIILATTTRMARFFSEIATSSPETFVDTAARYGFWLASPDESEAVTGSQGLRSGR